MRWSPSDVFLSNDVGEWLVLDSETFAHLTSGTLQPDAPAFLNLKAKHFLRDSASALPLHLLATKYRTKKSFLDGFTRLHIFVVTLRCDHTCGYCQVSRVTEDRHAYDMTPEILAGAVDFMFRSPAPELKVEFQGGEPLLNIELIRAAIEMIETRNQSERRRIAYVIATNLSHLTDDVLALCKQYTVHLSTSVDGPSFLHNANRPRPGRDSYERTVLNLQRARDALGPDCVSALMTTTELSLVHATNIVDEYVRLAFDAIFLRPISPYGFAVRSRQAPRYEAAAFVAFYKTALAHIIEVNRRGTALTEIYAQIILRKLLTPFPTGYVDLQSPAGAGISVLVYNYDGHVYASDEGRMLAEMQDVSFRLGRLNVDRYETMMSGSRLRAIVEQSVAETMPGCSECAYVPFCGTDPVFHWATQGDLMGHRPTSAFCDRNMAIIRHLVELLRAGDNFTKRLLQSWAFR